ncbi:hypothetical protein R6U79_13570 [Pseudomonas putida]|uniref:hypothetical protein n=1 Tax=Pseudomonas putida TaxID=303 RepID=UPI0029DE6DBB|nr:hypothetical protein [Pseudomonas putida]WPJ98278.1 hypothetical protein R6U79_13570 [Pseudomonas putida]
MSYLPTADFSDDQWQAFAEQRCEELLPHLAEFFVDRFAYKPRFVHQHLWRSLTTVSARTTKYDIYVRMFNQPHAFWSRECLVMARIGFKEKRVGHGQALVELFLALAPKLGYRFIAIESANWQSSAFAKRLGFVSYENGEHWVGSVEAIAHALGSGLSR